MTEMYQRKNKPKHSWPMLSNKRKARYLLWKKANTDQRSTTL